MVSLTGLQMSAIAGLSGLLIGGTFAWQMAYHRGYDSASKKSEIVRANLQRDLNTANGDVFQCKDVNASYQKSVADQSAKTAAILAEKMRRDDVAALKNDEADQRLLDQMKLTAQKAEEAREAIRAVDQCAKAGVSSDVVRVLNGLLPGAASVAADRPDVRGLESH